MDDNFIINASIFIVIIFILVIILKNPHKEKFNNLEQLEIKKRFNDFMSDNRKRNFILNFLKNYNLEDLEYGKEINPIKCAANFGNNKACCGQTGIVANKYICPENLPNCKGYVYNRNWGICTASDN